MVYVLKEGGYGLNSPMASGSIRVLQRFSLPPASSSSVGVSSAKRVSLAIFSTVFLLMKVVERSSGIFL